MAEYIKRETAVRAVMAAKWVDGYDGAMAMEIVASPPAADVVQVLRCKDCKDWGPGTGDVSICWETYEPMPPDGFCSIGERKPSADG